MTAKEALIRYKKLLDTRDFCVYDIAFYNKKAEEDEAHSYSKALTRLHKRLNVTLVEMKELVSLYPEVGV